MKTLNTLLKEEAACTEVKDKTQGLLHCLVAGSPSVSYESFLSLRHLACKVEIRAELSSKGFWEDSVG